MAVVVSNRLATCDYEALEEMLTSDVFDQVKRNLPHFTESQRQLLARKIEEIVISFIYDLEITESEYIPSENYHYLIERRSFKRIRLLS